MINQVGYGPKSIKIARSRSDKSFLIRERGGYTVAFKGEFSEPVDDIASGGQVRLGDFTSLSTVGEYIFESLPSGDKYQVTICESPYKTLQNSLLEMFYYQRCGETLSKDRCSKWAHGACHITKAKVFGGNKEIDVNGGWHDAGDYGRYVGPGAKAVADLLLTNWLSPTSDTQRDKVLEECRYELDWMLKMQDSDSGGVYHKVTTAQFIDNVMPDTNGDQLYLSPISPTATGAFVAVMALSSRIYRELDPEYAERSLLAALKGWNWLRKNPQAPGFTNPEGIVTGEYGDEEDGDERFWAAIELFLTTGDEDVHHFAIESYRKSKWEGLGWMHMGTYGVISYLFSDVFQKDENFFNLLKEDFVKIADRLSENCDNDGYGISLGEDYPWGSNEVVADNGMILLLAQKLTGNPLYREQAQYHLDYLLGNNCLGYCYVTGFGYKRVLNPHHRPSTAVGSPMPGMLSGGPNMLLLDPLAEIKLKGLPPAKCFLDEEPSYSTNEITIYWNSPLYFLVSAFMG